MLPVVEFNLQPSPTRFQEARGGSNIQTAKSSRDLKKGIRRRSSYGSAGRDSEASVFVILGLRIIWLRGAMYGVFLRLQTEALSLNDDDPHRPCVVYRNAQLRHGAGIHH
jgi:hypothetical protein